MKKSVKLKWHLSSHVIIFIIITIYVVELPQ